MVFFLSNYHRKDLPQCNRNVVLKLPYATNSTIELADFAKQALKQIYKEGIYYKKAGVIVFDLSPEEHHQTTLFDKRNERHIPLMKAVDKLNARYGQQKIRLAAQDLKRVWKMKQERLSPRYTTDLKDIIIVNMRKNDYLCQEID
jgi:DNA polymerase V